MSDRAHACARLVIPVDYKQNWLHATCLTTVLVLRDAMVQSYELFCSWVELGKSFLRRHGAVKFPENVVHAVMSKCGFSLIDNHQTGREDLWGKSAVQQ